MKDQIIPQPQSLVKQRPLVPTTRETKDLTLRFLSLFTFTLSPFSEYMKLMLQQCQKGPIRDYPIPPYVHIHERDISIPFTFTNGKATPLAGLTILNLVTFASTIAIVLTGSLKRRRVVNTNGNALRQCDPLLSE